MIKPFARGGELYRFSSMFTHGFRYSSLLVVILLLFIIYLCIIIQVQPTEGHIFCDLNFKTLVSALQRVLYPYWGSCTFMLLHNSGSLDFDFDSSLGLLNCTLLIARALQPEELSVVNPKRKVYTYSTKTHATGSTSTTTSVLAPTSPKQTGDGDIKPQLQLRKSSVAAQEKREAIVAQMVAMQPSSQEPNKNSCFARVPN